MDALTRLGDAEALALLEGGDLLELGLRADELRRRLHPGDEVTFIVDRNINYTDYCLSGCRFCAFYKKPGSGEGYLLTEEDIQRKIEETLALGGTAIMMQGGLSPDLDICWFEEVFGGIKQRFPQVHLHWLSPPEIVHIARQSGLTIEEALTPPAGSGPRLAARRRRRGARRPRAQRDQPTQDLHRHLARGDARGARPRHALDGDDDVRLARHAGRARRAPARIRDLQDETGGFTAFIPWTFQAGNTALEEGHVPATGIDYLRLLAVCRLYLDNVLNGRPRGSRRG